MNNLLTFSGSCNEQKTEVLSHDCISLAQYYLIPLNKFDLHDSTWDWIRNGMEGAAAAIFLQHERLQYIPAGNFGASSFCDGAHSLISRLEVNFILQ